MKNRQFQDMLSKEMFPLAPEQIISLKTDPDADLFPLMDNKSNRNLVLSVKEHGPVDAIVLNKDMTTVIKNRNLLTACIEAGVEPKFITFNGDEEDKLNFIFADKNRAHHSTSVRGAISVNSIPICKKIYGFQSDEEAINFLSEKLNVSPRLIKELKRLKSISIVLFNRVFFGELKVNKATILSDLSLFDKNLFQKLENQEISYEEAKQILALNDINLNKIFEDYKQGDYNRSTLPEVLTKHGYNVENMPEKIVRINSTISSQAEYKHDNDPSDEPTRYSQLVDSYSKTKSVNDNNNSIVMESEKDQQIAITVNHDGFIRDKTPEESELIAKTLSDSNDRITDEEIDLLDKIHPIYKDYANLHNTFIDAGVKSIEEIEKSENELYFLDKIGSIQLLNDRQCVPMNLDRSTYLLDKSLTILSSAISLLNALKERIPEPEFHEIEQIDSIINAYEEEFLEKMARNDKVRKTKSLL